MDDRRYYQNMRKSKIEKKKKKSRAIKVGISPTKKVLLEIANTLGEFYETGSRSYRPFRYPKASREDVEELARYRRLKQLEARKLIKIIKKGDELQYNLTENGKFEVLKARIIDCKDELPEGNVCVVMFDVPESIRKVRASIRTLLKQAGFYQVHRSVWETDKDVAYDFQKFVELLDADDFVEVYMGLPLRRR